MPPPVRWLLSLPDAVEQLERLDRDLITRRDLEELLGVSRSRAAALMRLFGAEMAGTILVLRRASLLRTFQEAIAGSLLLVSVLKPLLGSSMFRLECTNLEPLLPFQIERACTRAGVRRADCRQPRRALRGS